MLINYSAAYEGENLYHLVLIGESGAGNVTFRVKTDFGHSALQLATPVPKVYPNNETVITAVSTNSSVQQASLYYSIDDWNTSAVSEMLVSNRTCNGTIPKQEAGVTVSYRVEAFDSLDNMMTLNGSYIVKHLTYVSFTLAKVEVALGENISISGSVNPPVNVSNARVKLIFMALNGSTVEQLQTLKGNNFSASFKPSFLGSWSVRIQFLGDQLRHECLSNATSFVAVEPSFMSKYSMYIYAGGAGVAVLAVIVIIVVRRRQ